MLSAVWLRTLITRLIAPAYRAVPALPLERALARLALARALAPTEREIAARLFTSKRTVEHHVSCILAALGLQSRAEAQAYAKGRRTR